MRMQPLEPRRVRYPRGAYGWVDLKIVTGGSLERLGRDEALTYLFLCAVGNTLGISFWSTSRMARVLHLDALVLTRALEALVIADLIAWNGRVVQVLPLPDGVACTDARPTPPPDRGLRAATVVFADPPQVERLADATAARTLEPEAREHLSRFLGSKQPSETVVRAVARGLALKNQQPERVSQQAGRGKGSP